MSKKPQLIRITTVPLSLRTLLKGQMKYMSNKGFEVTAITSPGDYTDIIDNEQVPVVGIEMTRAISPMKDLKAVWQLYKYFKKHKPTIVHTHTPKAGIVGMMAGWLAGVPLRLHTVAGLPLLVATGQKRKILNIVEKATYFFAHRVYPNSHGLYNIIIDAGFTSKKKLKVIGNGSSNGINTTHFDPALFSQENNNQLKDLYQIKATDFVFIFVGRIVKDKGINELAQAFNKLEKEFSHVKLLIVGDFERELDPISTETDHIIQHSENIILTGFQKDVRPYFAISDALIFPSYREGFPNVVMQAGAMGIPSIVSNINGCNEIIIEGENGHIIPVKDADAIYESMKSLILFPDRMKTMTENARQYITSRYEQEVVWQAIHDEYQQLLQHHSS